MKTGTALVVDDEPLVRGYVGTILEEEGLEIRQASCGAEAFSMVEELGGHLDLIISDVVMPRGDGGWLVRYVRPSYPAIPMILMSALPMPTLGAEVEFVLKPFSREVLLALVRKVRANDVASGSERSNAVGWGTG